MTDKPKYIILGFRDASNVDAGCDAENQADTIKEARSKARYMMSEEYRRSSEASEMIQRVQIYKGNDCVEDFWA